MFMKKMVFALTIGVCVLAACKKSRSLTVEEELINKVKSEKPGCVCEPYIKKYKWNGDYILYVQYISGPACNGVPIYYNSKGERIALPSRITLDAFLANATLLEEVWSCKAQ